MSEKREFYTDENPGGPWSKALRAMVERDKRLEEEYRKRRRQSEDEELRSYSNFHIKSGSR